MFGGRHDAQEFEPRRHFHARAVLEQAFEAPVDELDTGACGLHVFGRGEFHDLQEAGAPWRVAGHLREAPACQIVPVDQPWHDMADLGHVLQRQVHVRRCQRQGHELRGPRVGEQPLPEVRAQHPAFEVCGALPAVVPAVAHPGSEEVLVAGGPANDQRGQGVDRLLVLIVRRWRNASASMVDARVDTVIPEGRTAREAAGQAW
jgi:hypothetical protein